MTKINHQTLLDAGFNDCIFAPIYLSRYSYYLGNLDWSKGETIKPKWWRFWEKRKYLSMNDLNWEDTTMLIAVSEDGESFIDWWSRERFWTIEEIKEYCKQKGIKMWSSKQN